MGRVVEMMPPTHPGPRRILQRTSKFTRKLVKSYQEVSTHPPPPRFRFSYGRLGEVRRAAEIPERIPNLLLLRWMRIFQRFREKAPRRH